MKQSDGVGFRPVLRLACCCLIAGSATAWQVRGAKIERLYVEPFTTKAGAEKIQNDVTAELRKLHSLSIVANETGADAILGGGGEIWVKGYRSLNPRSGRAPSNGTPVYGGFLSVELKNRDGATLWSYLAGPAGASEDVSRNLARQIAKHLAEALEQGDLALVKSDSSQPVMKLHGAGATFPYPVYSKWFMNYQLENPAVRISYDPVGSEAGIRKLLDRTVDFGASDCPTAIEEIDPREESRYLYFPSVLGAVVPIVNLPGIPNDIAFTPEALAGIYLGKITKWNDPVLQRANRGIPLPDLDIIVVHRSDGSGTSYAWTDYLSKTSPEWRGRVGASLTPKWPTGRGAAGNDGVAKLVKELGGSIGYVEFLYALQNHVGYGAIRNQNGEFVQASLESIGAAVKQSIPIGDDFKVSIVDAPGAGAYPVSSFTWIVVPAHIANEDTRNAVMRFLRWMIGPGQRQAAALGYLALPRHIVAKEEDEIGRIH